MSGTDLTARLTKWVQDAIDAAALGEEFPYSIVPAIIQAGPDPGQVLPAWSVLVMLRSPVLGSPPLITRANIPVLVVLTGMEDKVREAIHAGMGSLRDIHSTTLRALRDGTPAPIGPPPPGQARGN